MVKYDRLWETMKRKNVSQYRLINHYKISAGQLGRLRKNRYVSTHTLEMLCKILECGVEDVIEIVFDPSEEE
ncbi:MAG TPA: helix-turn-helix transcriptional regulator [Candidatus Copromonas avistercoris]|nr:helix-turn-helix transcriptional regulator [Candidatus Copromonas avistercoris]